MTHTPPQPAKRRWTPRLRFSLRVLLLTVTAFAIGFPIWYRWPYEETELIYPDGIVSIAGQQEWVPDKSRPPAGRVVRTWQRPWGSLKLHHVRTEFDQFERQLKIVQHHLDGDKTNHGPTIRMENGKVVCTGQYDHTQRTGTWVHYFQGSKFTARWRQDKLDGLYEIDHADGRKSQAMFAAGRMLSIDGQPVTDVLFDRLQAGIPDEELAFDLNATLPIGWAFVDTPLKSVTAFLSGAYHTPIVLDRRLPDIEAPITVECDGLSLSSALTFMLAPQGLACDYRYGTLWVTTVDDAQNWRDSTGVAEIRPPVRSALGNAWNAIAPFPVEAIDASLATVLQWLAQQQQWDAELDTSLIADKGITVTANIKQQPLRHVLGILLDQTNCRCKWEQGKLVILPPEAQK